MIRIAARSLINGRTSAANFPAMAAARAMTSVAPGKTSPSPTSKPTESKIELTPSSYWGISRPKITREDGTEWPWNCFMPWDTYSADVSIDLSKHHVPKNFSEKFAYRTVKVLRMPTD